MHEVLRFAKGSSSSNRAGARAQVPGGAVRAVLVGGVLALLAACQATQPPVPIEVAGEAGKANGFVEGYLAAVDLPDSLALVAGPPAEGSIQQRADLEAFQSTMGMRGTARWQQAQQDAQLRFPQAAGAFACELGFTPSRERTPHLTMLLRRSLVDAGHAVSKAKQAYARKRPFVVTGKPSCTPEQDAAKAATGSYPSGHASIGWAWGLVLASIAPERADALVQRGLSFGQSRVVCGVHWQSDVVAGRQVGAATFARLQANPTYVAQAALARKEILQAWSRAEPPGRECPPFGK